MPLTRSQKHKQQKSAARRQANRRAARLATTRMPSLSVASQWPLHAIFITKAWQETRQLTQILIARKGPSPLYAIGAILVDLGCLGVKNAFGRVTDDADYETLLHHMRKTQEIVETDPNLVAKIVREAVAYAGGLGFRPNRDLPQAMTVLGPADPDACPIEIPLGGPDGKPFYFAGPYDNARQVLEKLTRAVGEGNFDYVLPIDPDFEGSSSRSNGGQPIPDLLLPPQDLQGDALALHLSLRLTALAARV